jgi:hypothetical protein
MRKAYEAIAVLERIPLDGPSRMRALQAVRKWIDEAMEEADDLRHDGRAAGVGTADAPSLGESGGKQAAAA